ncbi:hypothetical protein N431DRAFT_552948 [Stipitochalara longipes BDJ]|nr:hypothetical protein N431DRAFT_552948 [Stipitochalara longipes BDJ]
MCKYVKYDFCPHIELKKCSNHCWMNNTELETEQKAGWCENKDCAKDQKEAERQMRLHAEQKALEGGSVGAGSSSYHGHPVTPVNHSNLANHMPGQEYQHTAISEQAAHAHSMAITPENMASHPLPEFAALELRELQPASHAEKIAKLQARKANNLRRSKETKKSQVTARAQERKLAQQIMNQQRELDPSRREALERRQENSRRKKAEKEARGREAAQEIVRKYEAEAPVREAQEREREAIERDVEERESEEQGGKSKQRKKRPYTRSTTGCKTCKKRHVKCDKARPTCQRCIKGGFICNEYDDDSKVIQSMMSSHGQGSPSQHGLSVVPRIRLPSAIENQKRKGEGSSHK